jgi:MATE family multidrug resistance protein
VGLIISGATMRQGEPPATVVAGGVIDELRATLVLALPLAGAQLAQVMMGFMAAAMLGRLGGDALAAGGLGNGLAFTVTLVFQGMLTAVGPLAAHAIGAGEEKRVGPIVAHGLLFALGLSGAGIFIILHLHLLLTAIGQGPSLVAATDRYLAAVVWGVPAALGYAVLRSYLSALSRTLPLMILLVGCLVLSVTLNYALIFGHFALPPLGIAGAGYANAIVQWVQVSALAIYVATHRGGRGREILRAMLRPARGVALPLLRLGWPIAGIFALEAGVFSTAGALAGRIGTASLAAHQVAISITGINFMVPLAFSNAATVRVALASGAGRTAAARRAGVVAMSCSAGYMVVMAIVLLLAPGWIISLYLDRADPANAEAVVIAMHLLFITALFQVFDGTQAVAAGALRGLRDTRMPLVIATVGYWVVGFGSAWTLAFPLGFGVRGLWWGLALGLAAVAILLSLRFHSLTDGGRYRLHGAAQAR